MPITATIRSRSDSLCQEVVLDGRHTLVIDEPEDLGGTDTAASPLELLAAAVAGCVTITVRMYARRKGWELAEVGVDVAIDRETRPARCTIHLHLPGGLDDEQVARLERIARSCPVSRMLDEGLELEHESAAATSA